MREFYTTGSPEMFEQIAQDWLQLDQLNAQRAEIEDLPVTYQQTPVSTVVVATKNAGKAREFAAMFAKDGITVKSLLDFPNSNRSRKLGPRLKRTHASKLTAMHGN